LDKDDTIYVMSQGQGSICVLNLILPAGHKMHNERIQQLLDIYGEKAVEEFH
jgi:hypothetical protein